MLLSRLMLPVALAATGLLSGVTAVRPSPHLSPSLPISPHLSPHLACTGASKGFPDKEAFPDDTEPLTYLTQMAKDSNAPVLITRYGTLDALHIIESYTAKHSIHDTARVSAAVAHYEPNIDFDALLQG